jgi:hypothetical protein
VYADGPSSKVRAIRRPAAGPPLRTFVVRCR